MRKSKVAALLGNMILSLVFAAATFGVFSEDIILYYNFNATQGDTVKDISGHGNDGTIEGVKDWVEGQHDGALVLDGGVTALTAQPSKSLTALTVPMTVGFIFQYVEQAGKWQSLAIMNGSADVPNGGWAAQLQFDSPTFTTLGIKDHISGKITLKAGEWYYLVYVYDGANASFYVNGELQDQVAGSGDIDLSKTPMLTMGVDQGTIGNYPANIVIDEFWISNTDKDQAEIEELANPEKFFSVVDPRQGLSTTWGKLKSL